MGLDRFMWFYFALYFAVWNAISLLIIKKLSRKIPELPLLFFSFLFTLPWMFLMVFVMTGFPKVDPAFFVYMFIAAVLDIIGFTVFLKAIKLLPISLIGPLGSFGSVFTTIAAYLVIGELPTVMALWGILLIVIGSYLLNLKDVRNGIFVPFYELFRNKGMALVLFASMLWAITPILQKKAIFATHPQTPLVASLVGFVIITCFFWLRDLNSFSKYKLELRQNINFLVMNGIGAALAQYTAYQAFATANLGYVTSVMRLSGVFTVIFGAIFLKEKSIVSKLIGSLIMLVGVVLIVVKEI